MNDLRIENLTLDGNRKNNKNLSLHLSSGLAEA